jgi:hypothetical protein
METGMESDVSDHLDHEEMYLMLQADMVNIILNVEKTIFTTPKSHQFFN